MTARGNKMIKELESRLRVGQVVELTANLYDDRGRPTMGKAVYTLSGIYPHHVTFTRKMKNGDVLTYSFTKAELTHMELQWR